MERREETVEPYPHERHRGLRAHSEARKQRTVERLLAAFQQLSDEERPVSASAVYDVSGLSFTTIRRNDEAYKLFCAHSDDLQKRDKRKTEGSPHHENALDSFESYSRQRLMTRLRSEIRRVHELNARVDTEVNRWKTVEAENSRLVQQKIADDSTIAKLRAKLARYESAFQVVQRSDGQTEQDGFPF